MRLTVRYFAAFREAAGTDVEAVNTSARTPDELFAECASRHAALRRFTSSRVAVNDELSDWNTLLEEGDEVLYFPPVAGG